jgi:hypothetical protein
MMGMLRTALCLAAGLTGMSAGPGLEARAEVVSLTVGLTPSCPYGLVV